MDKVITSHHLSFTVLPLWIRIFLLYYEGTILVRLTAEFLHREGPCKAGLSLELPGVPANQAPLTRSEPP